MEGRIECEPDSLGLYPPRDSLGRDTMMQQQPHALSEDYAGAEENPRPPFASYEDLAARVSLSLVDGSLTEDAVYEGCQAARSHSARAVLVRPSDIDLVKNWLAASSVKLTSLTGFPGGSSTTGARLYEARDVIRRGATELAVAMNLGKLISRKFLYLEAELLQLVEQSRQAQAKLRAVFEMDHLQQDHVLIGVRLCKRTGVEVMELAFGDSNGERQAAIVRYVSHHAKGKLQIGVIAPRISLDSVVKMYAAGADTFVCSDAATLLHSWHSEIQRRKEEEERRIKEHNAASSPAPIPSE